MFYFKIHTLLIHFSTLKNNIYFPTFSLTALKVMIGVVVFSVLVFSVGVVHGQHNATSMQNAFETALYIR